MRKLLLFSLLFLLSFSVFSQSTADTTFEGKVVSKAPDATIVSYKWAQVSGPNTATLATPNAATTIASNLIAGIYVFRFTITDNFGFSGSDDKKVTVNRNPQAPVADAGVDITVQLK